MKVCTTVDENLRLQEFPKAKFIVLFDDQRKEILEKIENKYHERPKVARQCISMKPEAVIAPHGSACYPSYAMFKRKGLKVFVEEVGKPLWEAKLSKEITWGEVGYSSVRAIMQRLRLVE